MNAPQQIHVFHISNVKQCFFRREIGFELQNRIKIKYFEGIIALSFVGVLLSFHVRVCRYFKLKPLQLIIMERFIAWCCVAHNILLISHMCTRSHFGKDCVRIDTGVLLTEFPLAKMNKVSFRKFRKLIIQANSDSFLKTINQINICCH